MNPESISLDILFSPSNISTDVYSFFFSVPSHYGYLPDSSVLKSVIAQLHDVIKMASGSVASARLLTMAELCVRSLLEVATNRLPPLNWAAILSALTREFPGLFLRHLPISSVDVFVRMSQAPF